MNVLIIADYRTPKSGNFIASVLDLGIAMRTQGHTVLYLFPDNHNGGYSWCRWIEKNNFKVILFDEKRTENEQLYHIRTIVSENHINIIHSHFGYLHRLLLTGHKKTGKDVKLLFHDHMDFSEKISIRKQKITLIKQAVSYRIFDAYVISVMEKKDRTYWPAGKKRHWYVANGLSLQRAERDLRTREELRAEIGVKSNEKLALFLGWDLHRKGLDIAVKAVKMYRKKQPDLKLAVIGAGRGMPYDRTVDFLEKYGCSPYEDWILYLNDYEDIFALNRAIDVYVSASRAEAFSYGILESISQDNPVVVSDIEGTSWAKKYDKCISFRNGDVAECARALEKALALRGIQSNYEDIINEYSSRIWCEKVISIYNKLLG